MTRVVIVGAGFGGLQCARKLKGSALDVVLIDRNNYHLFTPLLYQVAGALVNAGDIAHPLRAVVGNRGNVRFRAAAVTGVDLGGRRVVVHQGPDEPYDRLVLATGAEVNYYGQARIEREAYSLMSLPRAMELRNRVLTCFEKAAVVSDNADRHAWLTFVIVGAGPTGVEYAGALAELVRLAVRRDYRDLAARDIRIVLAEGLQRVLPAFPDVLGQNARRVLERRGVEVRLGVMVENLDDHVVTFNDGQSLSAHTLIWAAGVRPRALTRDLEVPRHKDGRVLVDAFLKVKSCDDVFAIGDAAAVEHNGKPLPMLAPPAMQQGRSVAKNLLREARGRPMKPFRYFDKGIMATIGRNAGVAAIGPVKLTGFAGWVAWLVVHLYFIIGFRNRVAVLARWAWGYIFYDRPIRFVLRTARRLEGEQ